MSLSHEEKNQRIEKVLSVISLLFDIDDQKTKQLREVLRDAVLNNVPTGGNIDDKSDLVWDTIKDMVTLPTGFTMRLATASNPDDYILHINNFENEESSQDFSCELPFKVSFKDKLGLRLSLKTQLLRGLEELFLQNTLPFILAEYFNFYDEIMVGPSVPTDKSLIDAFFDKEDIIEIKGRIRDIVESMPQEAKITVFNEALKYIPILRDFALLVFVNRIYKCMATSEWSIYKKVHPIPESLGLNFSQDIDTGVLSVRFKDKDEIEIDHDLLTDAKARTKFTTVFYLLFRERISKEFIKQDRA